MTKWPKKRKKTPPSLFPKTSKSLSVTPCTMISLSPFLTTVESYSDWKLSRRILKQRQFREIFQFPRCFLLRKRNFKRKHRKCLNIIQKFFTIGQPKERTRMCQMTNQKRRSSKHSLSSVQRFCKELLKRVRFQGSRRKWIDCFELTPSIYHKEDSIMKKDCRSIRS